MAAKKKQSGPDDKMFDPFYEGGGGGEPVESAEPENEPVDEAPSEVELVDPGVGGGPDPLGFTSHDDAMTRHRRNLRERRQNGELDAVDLGVGEGRSRRQIEGIRLELHAAMAAIQSGKDPVPHIARAMGLARI